MNDTKERTREREKVADQVNVIVPVEITDYFREVGRTTKREGGKRLTCQTLLLNLIIWLKNQDLDWKKMKDVEGFRAWLNDDLIVRRTKDV